MKQKAGQSVVDATLKFTLSALWNLTDESPTTCSHFIQNDGLTLFINVLEVGGKKRCNVSTDCDGVNPNCKTRKVCLFDLFMVFPLQAFPTESSIQQKVLGLLVSPG